MYSLRLLGGAVLSGRDGPLGGRIAQRRRLALLAVLAVSGPRPVSRDRLLALFWPESNSERARHSLADSIYQIRKELGDSALVSRGDDLLLNPEVVGSDVAAFEQALEGGDLRAAAAAYGGALLDGFHLDEAPEFEHWVDAERDRLVHLHLNVLEGLAVQAGADGDVVAAVGWWRRLAAHDPYNGRVALRLMEALRTAGDRVGAIRHARIHQALVAQEFGVAPDAAIEALEAELRSQIAATAGPTSQATAEPSRPRAEADRAAVVAGTGWSNDRVPADSPPVPDRPRSQGMHETAPRAIRWSTAGMVAAAIVAVGFAFGALTAPATPALDPGRADNGERRGLAVLPCINLSADPDDAYFSDGLTDELITALAQVSALQVVARTSAFAYRGESRDVRDVGRALNAETIVECSVRRAGDRFRVTAQLVDAANGYHLWAASYDQEGTDILALQTDLALRIAGALRVELSPAERARIMRHPTEHSDAHVLYLRGRHFWNRRTRKSFDRAIDYFHQAIEIDPRYAAAYAGLARAYSLQGLAGYLPPHEARSRMRAAAFRAVELDDGLAVAHAERGSWFHAYAWDSEASERAYQRAIALDSSDSNTRHMYGNLLRAAGRFDEAIQQKRMAVALDPLAQPVLTSYGRLLLEVGHDEDGLVALREAIELDSTFWAPHAGLGEYYLRAGRHEEAVQAFRNAHRHAGPRVGPTADLARALAAGGRPDEARRLLAEAEGAAVRASSHDPAVAFALVELGETDRALAWLERSYQERHPLLRFMDTDAAGPLTGDPRYLDLLRRAGRAPPRSSLQSSIAW